MTFPQASIDAAALRNNLGVVRRLAPRSRVLAVVKANAYGHGVVQAARALADADGFGVARLGEAVALRDEGITQRIVLLEGTFSADELAMAAQKQCEVVVHSFEQLSALEQFRGAQHLPVWLKINTGMNRLGFKVAEFATAYDRLRRCAAAGQLRLMTHLASAEERESGVTRTQLATFDDLTKSLQLERSAANSAGIIAWPELQLDWVRPGLLLYGMSPMADQSAAALGLRPAMTLTTQIIAVQELRSGEAVGYNGLWRAQRASRIAIAAAGYGDGYPRGMRSGAPVLVDGVEAKVVGRVSMDMLAIDVTDLPSAKVGGIVTLWGAGLPAERVAPYADTIAYELVCRVTERVTLQWH